MSMFQIPLQMRETKGGEEEVGEEDEEEEEEKRNTFNN